MKTEREEIEAAAAAERAKKRRTPAEMKAYFAQKIKEAELREKAEVMRLISDAHDTLAEAKNYEAATPHRAAIDATLQALSRVLDALKK